MVKFAFEDLEVWQKSVDYADAVIKTIDNISTDRKHYRLFEQLEAASMSIASNIAEGKGRYSKKEYLQFLYVARGSLYETVTMLTLFNRNNWINNELASKLKNNADEIGKMLSGLIGSIKHSIN